VKNMLIYYGGVAKRNDVSFKDGQYAPLPEVMEIFKHLENQRGFLGLVENQSRSIHILKKLNGRFRIELLDKKSRRLQMATVSEQTVEALISRCAVSHDWFACAKSLANGWQEVLLPETSRASSA
jgi:hypothetical protein